MATKLEQAEAYVERLRNDYTFFVRAYWDLYGLHKKHPWTDVEEGLCAFVSDFSITRKAVIGYRLFGKTVGVAVPYPCWRWLRNPNAKTLIVSQGGSHASATSHAIKGLLRDSPVLQHLQPRPSSSDRDNILAFDVAGAQTHRQASCVCLGMGGQLEGNHCDVIIADDIETKKNSWTPEGREKLRKMANEFGHIIYKPNEQLTADKADTPCVMLLGTPKDDETYYEFAAKHGYTVWSIPIVLPQPTEKVVGILAPFLQKKLDSGAMKPNDIVSPKRYDRRAIDAERANSGEAEFNRELKLLANLADSNRHPLRLSNLIVMDQVHRDSAPLTVAYGQNQNGLTTAVEGVPMLGFEGDRLYRPFFISQERAPYAITHAAIDPGAGGHDLSGFAVGGFLAGLVHVKAVRGLTGGSSPEALLRLATLCRDHGVNRVYIEQNMGHGMFDQLLWPVLQSLFTKPGQHPAYPNGWSCTIVHDTKITQASGNAGKDARIVATLEPVISQHRMVIDLRAITPEPGEPVPHTLQHQLTHITRDRASLGKPGVGEYGKADALSLLVNSFKSMLDVDPGTQAKDAIDRGDHQQSIEDMIRKLERSHTSPGAFFSI